MKKSIPQEKQDPYPEGRASWSNFRAKPLNKKFQPPKEIITSV
jgi:hypothetical protein